MKSLRMLIPILLLLCAAGTASGQNDARVAEQKRVIAALEKKIAAEEQEIARLRKGRSSTEEQVRRLARPDRLAEPAARRHGEGGLPVARGDRTHGQRSGGSCCQTRTRPAAICGDGTRSLPQLPPEQLPHLPLLGPRLRRRGAPHHRPEGRSRPARAQTTRYPQPGRRGAHEQETLARRRRELDSVSTRLTAQREKLQRDSRNAKATIQQLSKREKSALQRKIEQEQQLDVAISELRKLSKGNKEGASFSSKTSGLRLPVVNGRVKRYKGNMAEISGPKEAQVISIYDGKVVETKRNRITGKYEVFIAHGEYITSYANLGSVCVGKGQKIARNQQIGTIGSSVDFETMQTEYRIMFGIYPPDPKQTMRAENCFRR